LPGHPRKHISRRNPPGDPLRFQSLSCVPPLPQKRYHPGKRRSLGLLCIVLELLNLRIGVMISFWPIAGMNTAAREDNFVPLLSGIGLFKGLSREQLRFLAAECYPRAAPKGYVIFEKGSLLGGLYAVREGRVKLAVLSPDGTERVVQIVVPGETLGDSLGLIDRPSPVYAQALSKSSLLFFRADRVLEAALRWPTLGALLLAESCRRVHDLYRDLEACCLQSALQRVASFLLDSLDGCNGFTARTACQVVLPAGKAVVASRLNLTPETFSRELRVLSDDGVISVERCTVLVHDRDRLLTAAGCD
jgi:CRP-like cAMP-binding protein